MMLPSDCEAVIVACGVSQQLHFRLLTSKPAFDPNNHRPQFQHRLARDGHPRLNTLVIFLDSLSRRQFARKMPKTLKVLESLHRPPQQSMYEFLRIGTVGFDTGSNTRAMYMGRSGEQWSDFATHAPVWQTFRERGVVTSWMTNDCDDWSATYLRNVTSQHLVRFFVFLNASGMPRVFLFST
jgi:hypothetical protein